jgi:hypothetical protein
MGYEEFIRISSAFLSIALGMSSIVTGIIVAYIAWQQWKTNKQRLKAELYDRRFMAYETLMDTIGEAMRNGDISDEQLQKFNIQRRNSHFLFGEKLYEFLEEIYNKLVDLQTMNRASTDEKAKNAKKKADLMVWLYDQIGIARDKFQDDLSVE